MIKGLAKYIFSFDRVYKMFGKNNFSGFLGKGFGQKLIGGAKGLTHALDHPIHAAVSLAAEVGAGLATARKHGLLEKVKH